MIPSGAIQDLWVSEFSRILKRLDQRQGDRKTVFSMMMVKRDHKQRANPYDYLYPVFDMVVGYLGDYLYKFSGLEKELKNQVGISTDYSTYDKLKDLERQVDLLRKPDIWDTREDPALKPIPLPKLIRLYRSMLACRVKRGRVK